MDTDGTDGRRFGQGKGRVVRLARGLAVVLACLLLSAGTTAAAWFWPRPVYLGPVVVVGPSSAGPVRLTNAQVALGPFTAPGGAVRSWRANLRTLDVNPRSTDSGGWRLMNKRTLKLGPFVLVER